MINMTQSTIHIAFCTDSNYTMPTGVAMISICENNKCEDIEFHIVFTEESSSLIGVEQKAKPLLDIAFKYNKKIKVYPISSDFLRSFECGEGAQHVTVTGFARIFLPEIIDNEITKILYLDGDIIVEENLSDLWNIQLPEECPVGGVVDIFGNSPLVRKETKTSLTAPYINSGVLLMNLALWRKEKLSNLCVRLAQSHHYPFLDQDTINVLFADRIFLLPPKFNLQNIFLYWDEKFWQIDEVFLESIRQAIKKPSIIHYSTAHKPWKISSMPLYDNWRKYQEISVWKDNQIEEYYPDFKYTHFYSKLRESYWSDPILFSSFFMELASFFDKVVKIKHKTSVLKTVLFPIKFVGKLLDWHLKKSDG